VKKNIKLIHFNDRKVFVNTFLLFYTLLCVCFYDPIVSVDNTPRTPLFKEVISNIYGLTFSNSRNKLFDLKFKELPLNSNVYSKYLSFSYLSSTLLIFYLRSVSILFFFNRHSIVIRAPSFLPF